MCKKKMGDTVEHLILEYEKYECTRTKMLQRVIEEIVYG